MLLVNVFTYVMHCYDCNHRFLTTDLYSNFSRETRQDCLSEMDYAILLRVLVLFAILFEDLNNPEIYRDLSKPVGALNKERLEKLLVSDFLLFKEKN